jgi:hypothetical protein
MFRKLVGQPTGLAGIALALALLFLSVSHLQAQTTAVAQVSGTVTDASGGAVVNAQVTMTETDKGQVQYQRIRQKRPLRAAQPSRRSLPL